YHASVRCCARFCERLRKATSIMGRTLGQPSNSSAKCSASKTEPSPSKSMMTTCCGIILAVVRRSEHEACSGKSQRDAKGAKKCRPQRSLRSEPGKGSRNGNQKDQVGTMSDE